MKEKDYEAHFEIGLKTKRKDLEFESSNEFLLQDIPHDLQNISFTLTKFGDFHTRIEIEIGFRWWETPEIVISGKDSFWVNGIVKEIEDIFDETPTKHYIIQNNKIFIPIVIGIIILSGVMLYFTFSESDLFMFESEYYKNYSIIIPLIISTFPFVVLFPFFKWLFPIIEFENIGIQQKIRKGVLAIMIMIIAGIIATTIFEKIQ